MDSDNVSLGRALAKKLGQDLIPPVKEEHTSALSILMNPLRFCMFLLISERPGISLREISREAEASSSTTKFHLNVLEERGLIASFKGKGKNHYYLPVVLGEEECKAIYPLSDKGTLTIYKVVRRTPVGVSQIAKEVGITPQLATYHLRILMERGLVEKRGKKYAVTDMASNLKTTLEERASSVIPHIMELLKEENLSPSKMRKYKNRIRVEVTLGRQRPRATVYTVPQTLG